jgi:hypothetical protein
MPAGELGGQPDDDRDRDGDQQRSRQERRGQRLVSEPGEDDGRQDQPGGG